MPRASLPPTLPALDETSADVLVAWLREGERPPRGLAGLVDYRLRDALSKLMRQGLVSGRRGERVLLPGAPLLPVARVLFWGVGPALAHEEHDALQQASEALAAASKLLGNRILLEAPAASGLATARLLLTEARGLDVVLLTDDVAIKRAMLRIEELEPRRPGLL